MRLVDPLPLLVVFGLDYTLWPFWVDSYVRLPLSEIESGEYLDAHGKNLTYFKDVPKIFRKLKKAGIKIGVTSHSVDVKATRELLQLFGWMQYITYSELVLPYKTEQFEKMQRMSGIEYSDMLFFDDWEKNVELMTRMGVQSILVSKGLTMRKFENGIKAFQAKKQNATQTTITAFQVEKENVTQINY